MNVILSEKGQLTVPKKVRNALGLRAGSILNIDAIHGKLVGKKVLQKDIFQKWRGKGKLPKGMSVDQYLKATRDGNGD